MRNLQTIFTIAASLVCVCGLSAQTPLPLLGSIEAPYANLQGPVVVAGKTWAAGAVAYGPVNTPLVISGENFGGGGTVQFVPYKNGAVDGAASSVQATVTLWASNMLVLTVPSGAVSGLVTVTVEGQTSNGLPFIVTPGQYSAICPAGPTASTLQITTTSLHDGSVGQPYSATLGATGGTGTYTWSIASGALPAGLSLSASMGSISGTPTAATGTNPAAVTFQVKDSSSPQQIDQALINLTVQPQVMTAGGIYSYSLQYDGIGNVTQMKDQTYQGGPGIMGTWDMAPPNGPHGYDPLNRLIGASVIWPNGALQYYCWSYDSFGNRLHEDVSSQSFQSPSGGGNTCTAQSNAWLGTNINTYTIQNADPGNNRIQSTNARGVAAQIYYDSAGNVLNDGANKYLYDSEGRLCAVANTPMQGMTTMTGYLYDDGGNRVAKGTITFMACDPATSGFHTTEQYILGANDEELTTLDGGGKWQRTNIFAAGKLISTYDLVADPTNPSSVTPALHFHLNDTLGTRRMQVSGMFANLGQPELDFQSLPFGDQEASFTDAYAGSTAEQNSLGATPLFYTGKERDSESGNDYFGARYYSSAMGRWLSPDPGKISSNHLFNPQKWNKYNYVLNNPLAMFDPDGQAEVKITIRAFIPESNVHYAGMTYKGDNRSFSNAPNASSRVQVTFTIETDPSKSARPLVGTPSATTSGSQVTIPLIGTFNKNSNVTAETNINGRTGDGTSVVSVSASGSDPLFPAAPSVDGTFTFNVSPDGQSVSMNGAFTAYPAWEVYAENTTTGGTGTLLQISPEGTGHNSPGALLGGDPAAVKVNSTTQLTPPPTSCSGGQSSCKP